MDEVSQEIGVSIRTLVSSEAITVARCSTDTAASRPGSEAPLRALEQVHQTDLAEPQPERVRQRRLQSLLRQSQESLEIRRDRMKP